MKINKKQFRRWLDALYNEEYPQGKGSLEDFEGRCCCLGVACKVLIPDKKLFKDNSGIIIGAYPAAQLKSQKWLQEINNNFHRQTEHRLSALNDTGTGTLEKFTHPEIAMLLDLVYTYKMLD